MQNKVLIVDEVWQEIRQEAKALSLSEPILASFYHANILNHTAMPQAVSFYLASLLATDAVPAMVLREVFLQILADNTVVVEDLCRDLAAHRERDPACDQYAMPFLYFKGFQALQSYRLAHWLWQRQRQTMALYIQNQASEVFAVDIHPAAQLGSGIMIDHATGVVIGETAIMEDNVSLLHEVTLGGSGTADEQRHPAIRHGVLISAGAKILGNIEIGACAKIGAGSVVLASVEPHRTAVGVPARSIGGANSNEPALDMDHNIELDD